MRTIYKYTLGPDKLKIEMPEGAILLHVDEQAGEICVWAEVDTEQPIEIRYFEVFGTGHKMKENMGTSRVYIGTAKLQSGSFIFHVYEYTGI